MKDHPLYLAGKLQEQLAEAAWRTTMRLDHALIHNQLGKAMVTLALLETSLERIKLDIQLDDATRLLADQIEMEQLQQGSGQA